MNVKLLLQALIGGMLLVLGVALLVLPGPGLLVVLAGLIMLSTAFPSLERYVDPVRTRAIKTASGSVSSPWRLAGSILASLALVTGGLVWGLVPGLPYGGWHTGSSVILSGVLLFASLIYALVQVRRRNKSR
jgi:hypothetical protein